MTKTLQTTTGQELQPARCFIILCSNGAPSKRIAVQTADEASDLMRLYVDFYQMGVSAFKTGCGDIVTASGEIIARVSYNGRVWAPDGRLLQDIEDGLPID